MTNQEVAAVLEGVAKLLELQEANPIRVRSYRHAAEQIRLLRPRLTELYKRSGREELCRIKGIEDEQTGLILQLLKNSHRQLKRLAISDDGQHAPPVEPQPENVPTERRQPIAQGDF